MKNNRKKQNISDVIDLIKLANFNINVITQFLKTGVKKINVKEGVNVRPQAEIYKIECK